MRVLGRRSLPTVASVIAFGSGTLRGDGLAEPLVELLQGIGMRGVLAQFGALVAFAQFGDSGLPWHLEDAGHPGMGDSIAAAVRATAGAAGWLVLPADLPLVRPETLRHVADALAAGAAAVHPQYEGQRGHPVAFAAGARDALLALSGERGAAPVLQALRARGEVLDLVVDDVGTVTDVDTLADLAAAEALLAAWGVSSSR
jgi:molybdenum cofactor cytidylyltransferase